jgi:hypothetical protein
VRRSFALRVAPCVAAADTCAHGACSGFGSYGGDRGGDRGGRDRYAFSGGGYQEPVSRSYGGGGGGGPGNFDVRRPP